MWWPKHITPWAPACFRWHILKWISVCRWYLHQRSDCKQQRWITSGRNCEFYRSLCFVNVCIQRRLMQHPNMSLHRVSEAHLHRSCSRGMGTAIRCPSRQQIPHRTWWSPSVWSRFLVPTPLRPRSRFLSHLSSRPGLALDHRPHRLLKPLPAQTREGEPGRLPPRTLPLPPTGEDPLLLDVGEKSMTELNRKSKWISQSESQRKKWNRQESSV